MNLYDLDAQASLALIIPVSLVWIVWSFQFMWSPWPGQSGHNMHFAYFSVFPSASLDGLSVLFFFVCLSIEPCSSELNIASGYSQKFEINNPPHIPSYSQQLSQHVEPI